MKHGSRVVKIREGGGSKGIICVASCGLTSYSKVSSVRTYFKYFRKISNGPLKRTAGWESRGRTYILLPYRFRPADNTGPPIPDWPAEAFPAFVEDVPSFSFVSIPGSNVRPSPADWSPLSAAAAAHFFSRPQRRRRRASGTQGWAPGTQWNIPTPVPRPPSPERVRYRPLESMYPGILRAGIVRVL